MNVPKLRFKEFQGDWEKQKIGNIFQVTSGSTPLRSESVILPLLMDRISRIKCSSMAAYRRWLDEAFHGCKTTANEWHGLQHRSNY